MRRGTAHCSGAIALLLSGGAMAEPSGAQKAAAEALFQEGADLVGAGEVAKGCQKFAASQELEPALGTLLRLADCRDREGKTASAWAHFMEAAALAGQRGEAQRQELAKQRAADLEARLSKVVLRLPSNLPDGVSIELNGLSIPKASWSSPLPIDPGKTRLEVSAEGYRTWTHAFDTPAGSTVSEVKVPELEPEPVPIKTEEDAAPRRTLTPRSEGDGSLETVGYVVGVLGLVGLGVGSYMTVKAYDANSESLDYCREEDKNRCTARGTQLRDDALSYADGATVAFAVGGSLLVAGVVLVLISPGSKQEAPVASLTLSGDASRAGGGLRLGGSF